MSPQEFITDLTQRYAVSRSFAERMLPLARRADEVAPDLRRRLHAFIERSFLAQTQIDAEEKKREKVWKPASPEDAKLLAMVAGILDRWEPPRWLALWAERLEREPWLAPRDPEAPGGGAPGAPE